MKFKHVDFIDTRVSQAKSIIEAVMDAGHAPCEDSVVHEHALWGACDLLQQALNRLRDDGVKEN
jgi:hypothetical protein